MGCAFVDADGCGMAFVLRQGGILWRDLLGSCRGIAGELWGICGVFVEGIAG